VKNQTKCFPSLIIGTASNETFDQSSCPLDAIQENVEVEGEVEQHENVDGIKTDDGKLTEPDISYQSTEVTQPFSEC